MATVRLRAVALLLLLQYFVGVEAGAATTCPCASPLPSSTLCTLPECTPSTTPWTETTVATEPCKTLKCTNNLFLVENQGGKAVYEGEIKCDKTATKKWTAGSDVVTKAVCVENFPCGGNSKLKSDCDGFARDVNCEKVTDFKETGSLTCPTTAKKLFFNKKGGTVWTQATDVECGKQGAWTVKLPAGAPPQSLLTDDELVCADKAPGVRACACSTPLPSNTHCIAPACLPSPTPWAPTPAQQPELCASYTCASNLFLAETQSGSIRAFEGKIECSKPLQVWMVGSVALTSAVCAHMIPCTAYSPLKSACPSPAHPDVKCEMVPPTAFKDDATPFTCPTATKKFFFKKAGEPTWTIAARLTCNLGEWTATLNTPPSKNLVKNDELVCADMNPDFKEECTVASPLASSCASIDECDQVTLSDTFMVTCSPGKKVYYNDGTWHDATDFKCNQFSGKWMSGTPGNDLSGVANVVCSTDTPWDGIQCAATLKTDCPADVPQCKKVTESSGSKKCSGTTPNLFFKRKAVKSKWIAAVSVNCAGGRWTVKYKFGAAEKEETLEQDESVICDVENPDRNACLKPESFPYADKHKFLEHIEPLPSVEVGTLITCPPGYDTYSEDKLVGDNTAVCGTESNPDDAYNYWQSAGNKMRKILCRVDDCRSCMDKPKSFSTIPGEFFRVFPTAVSVSRAAGSCSSLDCTSQMYKKYVVREEDSPTEYRYLFDSEIVCKNKEFYTAKGNMKKVLEVECVQYVACHDIFKLAGCLQGPSVVGCQELNDIDFNNFHKELSCPASTKMIIKNSGDEFWDDVEFMRCNQETAEWNVTLSVDPQNHQARTTGQRVVCVAENPNPRPTTTTTTTTPAPYIPICELCNATLPANLECGKCSNKYKTTEHNNTECRLQATDPKAKIVINDFVVANGYLKCVRKERNGVTGWTTESGSKVNKFAAQRESPIKQYGAGFYGIIFAALLINIGMAFGCFFIYMRCRKIPKSMVPPKKERGVTRKYSSTNIVKTEPRETKSGGGGGGGGGGKSGAKSDVQSKEPTPSKKADSNIDEAPTLKF